MTAPKASPGLWIPFANPVEIFPVSADGAINYGASYNAVCHRLTTEGMMLLQPKPEAPLRMVVGVHCEGHVFFLPGNRADFGPLGGDVFELQARFTMTFDPKGPPPKIEFVTEAEVGSWVREIHGRRTPETEKRKHERAVYNEEIEVDGPGRNKPAYALNISEGGIALITTFLLAVGEVRILQLPQPDGTAIQKKTRIVRCSEIIPRFYEVGGQFVTT
jgi:PilZ domain